MLRWRIKAVLASSPAGHDRCPAVSPRPDSAARRSRGPLAVIVLAAAVLVLGACREAPSESPVGGLPGVPPPAGAVLDVGAHAFGHDASRAFVAYRSMDAPSVVAQRYEAELRAAGWQLVQRMGTWSIFRRGPDLVSVSISSAGPPTYVIVQEGAVDGNTAIGPAPSEGASSRPGPVFGTPAPPTRRPSTPPGQASTPPGHGGTPPGQASTPPGHGGTPPGRGKEDDQPPKGKQAR